MTRRARNARRAAQIGAMSRRLRRLYDAAPEWARADGREWYPRALDTAADIAADTGLPAPRVAAVIAALSPQVRWRENVDAARRLCAAQARGERLADVRLPGYHSNHAKARAILQGEPIGRGAGRDAFGGEAPKVRAFWANICGDSERVTLDIWAMRAALGARQTAPPSGDAYRRGEMAYRHAAHACGEAPCDFQAIIWHAARGAAEHAADLAAMNQRPLFATEEV